jgi:ChrR Cupin-like domain
MNEINQNPDSSSLEELSPEDITAMAYSVPLVPLPTNLKSRLMASLASQSKSDEFITSPEFEQLLLEPIETLITIAQSLIWKPFPAPEGSTYAPWKLNPQHRQTAFFLRVPTAGTLRKHRHATGETVLVLEGDFTADGKIYRSGDRSIRPAGSIHQPTTQGCLVLCISSLDDEILN